MVLGVINQCDKLEVVATNGELGILKRQRPALHILIYPRVVGIADIDNRVLIEAHTKVEAVVAIGNLDIIHISRYRCDKVETEVLATSNSCAIDKAILGEDNPVVTNTGL